MTGRDMRSRSPWVCEIPFLACAQRLRPCTERRQVYRGVHRVHRSGRTPSRGPHAPCRPGAAAGRVRDESSGGAREAAYPGGRVQLWWLPDMQGCRGAGLPREVEADRWRSWEGRAPV